MISDNYCKCPVCGGYSIRIRRRRIDRLMSLFTPAYRYSCQYYYCKWEGNIPISKLQKPSKRLFN